MELRMYPIMGGPTVPWEVMTPHNDQAEKNHSQSLERLAARGGLSSAEAWCVVQGISLSRATKQDWHQWEEEWRKFAIETNARYGKLRKALHDMVALYEREQDFPKGAIWRPNWLEEALKL